MTHPATAPDDAWTTRGLLDWTRRYFEGHGVGAPRVVAEMLLAHVLGCERMRLYMEVDRPASASERERFRELVARAGRGEPVQYLTGEAAFHLRSFEVAPITLIPQPSTETLVEAVLDACRDRAGAPLRIADVGTGSGVIAVTLAAGLPGARIVATDVRADCLDLTRRNAARHGVEEHIELRVGAGVAPLRDGEVYDVICSNPPYVPQERVGLVEAGVRTHVPESAWNGGPGGLAVIGPLLEEAPSLLRPGGLLAVEIDDSHHEAVLSIAEGQAALEDADLLRDHEGFWRVLLARRRA